MGAFVPRGWRLVRLGGAAEPRLGAIDPEAPAVVRELRERDPMAALATRSRALRRRAPWASTSPTTPRRSRPCRC